MGEHARAAEHYESFHRLSPGHRDAPSALRAAGGLRLQLGELDRALEDARLFEKSYGRRLSALTALVLLSAGEAHVKRGDWSAAESYFATFLRRYAARASPDVVIRAHVDLGRARWKRAGMITEAALQAFRVAVARADEGRVSGEGDADRLSRYERLVTPIVGLPEGSATASARLRLLGNAVEEARAALGAPRKGGSTAAKARALEDARRILLDLPRLGVPIATDRDDCRAQLDPSPD
jgi:tetratricopeptide (TPR) repeat protein